MAIGQDFDAACVKTMQANGHRVLGGDIREIQPQQLLDMTGLSVGEPFLICGLTRGASLFLQQEKDWV